MPRISIHLSEEELQFLRGAASKDRRSVANWLALSISDVVQGAATSQQEIPPSRRSGANSIKEAQQEALLRETEEAKTRRIEAELRLNLTEEGRKTITEGLRNGGTKPDYLSEEQAEYLRKHSESERKSSS